MEWLLPGRGHKRDGCFCLIIVLYRLLGVCGHFLWRILYTVMASVWKAVRPTLSEDESYQLVEKETGKTHGTEVGSGTRFLKANKHGSTWLRYKRHQLELFNHLWMLLPPVAHPIAHPFFHIFRCPPGCLGTSGCMLPPGETRQRFGHRMSRTIHLFEATRIPRARQ